MKLSALLAVLLAAAGAAFSPSSLAQASERHKVVIQVSDNDPAKWNLAGSQC